MADRSRDSKSQSKIKQQLLELLKLPENKFCAECGMKQPRWASSNLGVFICIRCSGIHRSLGVHITKVRSVTLDSWTEAMANVMMSIGNEKANSHWEANLPEGRKPGPNDTTYAIESFIKDKYVNKRYVKKGSEPPSAEKPPAKKKSSSKKTSTKKSRPVEPEQAEIEAAKDLFIEEDEPPKATKKEKPKKSFPKEEAKTAEPKKSIPKPEKDTTKSTPADDLLNFSNFTESLPSSDESFEGFFNPEVSAAAPVVTAPVVTAPFPSHAPKTDIMSLFTQPQPQVFASAFVPSVPIAPGSYIPYPYPGMVGGYPAPPVPVIPVQNPPRRKVHSTNDVMSLF